MITAATADTCTAELILLSCAALFHILIIDVMLPVRYVYIHSKSHACE